MARRLIALIAASAATLGLTALPSAKADTFVPPCTDTDSGAVEFTLASGAHGFYAVPETTPVGMVVFSHGYGHSSYSWKAHLARTAASLNVIAVAVDGRGLTFTGTFKSDGVTPNTSGWPVQAAAEDGIEAGQLFEAACPGLGTIVNYGVSLGGNTSGIMAKAGAKRADGVTPLFDWWVDIEGVNNLLETYTEARAVSPSAAYDIQQETGGPIELVGPDAYTARTNVLHAADMKAAGLKGVVLVQGVDDGLVPYNQSQEMFDALNAAGIPAQYFTVTLKDDQSERETTISGNVGSRFNSEYRSPLAGHASEMSTTHIVSATGFERLDAIFGGKPPACTRVYWVDGQVGGAPSADDPAYAC